MLKFGADPEFFSAYEDEGLNVLPPVVLRTDFNAPFEENGRHPVFMRNGKSYVHEDGAAFEMSVPPSHDWRDLFNTIKETREMFESTILSKYGDACFPSLFAIPTITYQVKRWIDRGPEFEMATLFGCDADEDAYNTKVKCKVINASLHPERYAGGHIHFSGVPAIEEKPLIAIRSLAMTAGLAATAFSDVPDLEKRRLFLYGKPGKFRVQEYPNGETGIEYRTPSTRWTSSFELAEKVFSWAEIGIRNLLEGDLFSSIVDEVETPALESILSCNQPLAKELLGFIESKV